MIALIAAVGGNNVIGCNGTMPWHIPEDLHHFRDLTMGHTVVMGRRTFESIGHPLVGRRNIVLTHNITPANSVECGVWSVEFWNLDKDCVIQRSRSDRGICERSEPCVEQFLERLASLADSMSHRLRDAPLNDASFTPHSSLLTPHSKELFVIGGGEVYRQFMPFADRIYLTVVEGEWAGDTFFPAIDPLEWHLTNRQPHPDAATPFEYRIYDRVRS